MGNKFFSIFVVLILGSSAIIGACEKKPEKELSDAERAVSQAEQEGAAQYLPDEWNRLKSALEEAKSNIQQKKYKKAREQLISIIQDAISLKEKVVEKKKEEEQKKQEGEQAAPEQTTETNEGTTQQ